MSEPRFFATPADLRRWFRCHHEPADELLVGFYKKSTGKPSVTWEESRDQALCFGWIDGIRRRIDEESFTIRFTPRRSTSTWSRVNHERMKALIEDGQMTAAGLVAYESRDRRKDEEAYSYERGLALTPDFEQMLRSERVAWSFFEAQPPGYRRTAGTWVMSAKRDETRQRRLHFVIECSARRERIPQLGGPARPMAKPTPVGKTAAKRVARNTPATKTTAKKTSAKKAAPKKGGRRQ
jgi:uncharacterized protein YdeI (YjbR/CyaY-like superfamily)